ncbi:cytokinesis protein 3 [Myotisia sp. PD_48]|nr:cytokinesis protein 3 [Myotisia sp. PD_48]
MALQAPSLPVKFPCWCRAVYSWGGENKSDLGFVEGDLIECLNAGDGSWWTGRLRRDKRMVGVFPSNFVKVLEEDFVPASRSVSPLPPGLQSSNSTRISSSSAMGVKKQKTVFRKPFQGYKEVVGPSAELARKKAEESAVAPQIRPVLPERVPTPIASPKPRYHTSPSRQLSRSPSPAPFSVPIAQREPQQPQHEREPSPPPPPPPPHRIAVRSYEAYTPTYPSSGTHDPYRQINHNYRTVSRTPSPCPPSPSVHGHTPSPLRDAMDDVMSSLQDMGMARTAPPPELPRANSPFNPWSPDAFNQLHDKNLPTSFNRPSTSMGLEGGQRGPYDSYQSSRQLVDSHGRFQDGPPQLGNYVQRMESRLRQLHDQDDRFRHTHSVSADASIRPPSPPKKGDYGNNASPSRNLRHQKSNYDLGLEMLGRSFTTKSNTTNSSSGVQSNATSSTSSTGLTTPSIMSGASAGATSATSARSYAARARADSYLGHEPINPSNLRSTGFTGFASDDFAHQTPPTSSSSHLSQGDSRQGAASAIGWTEYTKQPESPSVFGGLTTPKSKKSGFLKKILESAKTGAATARSTIGTSQSGSVSPSKGMRGISSPSPTKFNREAGNETGLGSSDWVQVRRDVNRATTPCYNELVERAERCQMMDYPVIYSVEELYESAEGDEGIDGLPIAEPTNFAAVNLQLVDKSARFINSLPPMTNPVSLTQGYVCRPYRSDIQRLRAIFTWVSEKIMWDDDIENEVDVRRVIQMKTGCPQEIAVLVMEMCAAVGLQAEAVQGYLKDPGEQFDLDSLSRPNHWWNTVLIDGEWRIMDCSLASPTHPRRVLYSRSNPQSAEFWYFLTRPMEICYTHVPIAPEHQHICPPMPPDVLLSLPSACPAYFKSGLHIPNFDTSLVHLNDLEVLQVRIHVPHDIECVAEVEAIDFARDADGDFFESGDITKKRALAQPDWLNGQKRFIVKALLPGDEGQAVLKVYAGKKGLMHSTKDIPYPLAFALPIVHTGENPPYEFFLRHPTPHAQRHDLYVIQPQCARLTINNTFVFAVRQHPSHPYLTSNQEDTNGRASPNPFARPSSSLSMVSSVASQSNASTVSLSGLSSSSNRSREKPAKLAMQSPSGKILRLTRKADHMLTSSNARENDPNRPADGTVWETVIKVSERGTWRGLVLADRTARWCVWGEWECY